MYKLITLCRHLIIVCHHLDQTSCICISDSRFVNSSTKEKGTMLRYEEHRSEVARLLSQITAEYEAAQRGLTGLAYGTSQHEFITARMENMGQLHGQLQSLVGDIAIAMIADQLNNTR